MDTLAQFFAQGEPVREDLQQVTNGLVLTQTCCWMT